jgi:hypothetical protein
VHTKNGVSNEAGDTNMMTKTVVALALALATTAGALAATKQRPFEAGNSYINTDPDLNVRWEMRRDPSTDR